MTYKRLTAVAGLIAWMMVGLPAFIYHTGRPGWSWGWIAAFIIFGGAFAADLARPRWELLLAESAAAITLVLLRCNGYEGTLLVVLAMQLGPRFERTTGLIWIGAQTLLLAAAVVWRLNPRAALLLAPPYFGFQLLAFFVFHTMAREAATHERPEWSGRWTRRLTTWGTAGVLLALVASGKLRPRESVAQGIAAAPEAFLGLLKGKNFGKQLVKLI